MQSVKSEGHITCRTKGIFRCISFPTGGIFLIIHLMLEGGGHVVVQLVEALCDKMEGTWGEFLKHPTAHCECTAIYVGFSVSAL